MTEEKQIPNWVKPLSEAIANTIEFEATARVGWFYNPPGEEEGDIHSIILYPEPDEIQEAGPRDGEYVFPLANAVDILEAQKKLDEVTSVIVQFEPGERPVITLEGTYQGQSVIVFLYLQPPPDDIKNETD